jgi:5-methylcytosine-specific restriction endonuclease McrA
LLSSSRLNQLDTLRSTMPAGTRTEYNREWRRRNAERVNARVRARYAANPESNRQRAAAWQKANPQRRLEITRAWDERNPENRKDRARKWQQANPDKVRANVARRRARMFDGLAAFISVELLDAKWAYWGGCCWMCGEEATTWDHVKPLSKGGRHLLANLRPACGPCNYRKHAKWPVPTNRRSR